MSFATSSLRRGAKLASLPASYAGRTALGVGRHVGGRPAEVVATEIQRRTAEQLFRVLGELKGGAMKLGQALSVFEAVLPEEIAGPYRASLTALQNAAPPLPASVIHKTLADELGPDWRRKLPEFCDKAAGAASIGQVHRALWRTPDGDVEVAVKVQYPGVAKALKSDLRNLARLAKLFSIVSPGIDVAGLCRDLADRLDEELDYELEADNQRRFAAAFDGSAGIGEDLYVPAVYAATPRVLISEWLTGRPLSEIIASGTQSERDRAGGQLVRAVYSGPARTGLMHADPHPGNFLVLPDGRLGVLDFGAVKPLPGGLPEPLGALAGHSLMRDGEGLLASMHEFGFLKPDAKLTADEALGYFVPMCEMFETDTFHFTRTWLRRSASHFVDPRQSASLVARGLTLPGEYFTVHRVALGVIGILAQLDCEVPMRTEELRWVTAFRAIVDPDWNDPGEMPGERRRGTRSPALTA
jgi:predicted unusual protein kinase regulating ubiquinone biosynthesis (AarF/ABC1/UbiB family)